MSKMTKNWWCILALTGGLLLATVPGEAASAEKQSQKGIEAYQNLLTCLQPEIVNK